MQISHSNPESETRLKEKNQFTVENQILIFISSD